MKTKSSKNEKNNEIQSQLTNKLAKAYSPYSKVKVAAAIEYTVGGEERVAYGVNVENVSYGLTVCAERSAISNAIIDGMTSISAVHVMSNQAAPISPCGACRQVLSEFMSSASAPVICVNESRDKLWSSTMGELLPNRFDL